MTTATMNDYLSLAVGVADNVSDKFQEADYYRALTWSFAMTNAAILRRLAAHENTTATSVSETSAGMGLSTEFAHGLIAVIEADFGQGVDDQQKEGALAYFEAFLESALIVVDAPDLTDDPGDISRFLSVASDTMAVEEARTIDDRMALSIIADLIMAKLNWMRSGPSSSYGFVQTD